MAQSPTTSDRPHVAAKRYIYAWGAGTAEGNGTMKDLLGGKGAGLAEMTLAGLPTPPGFTITTEACNDYFASGKQLPAGLWDDVLGAVKQVEERSGKGFGDPKNPLLVSVRSGAKFSMPGMMDTVLNLGLNEETLAGLIELSGNERFGWDAYRRFIGMFGRIVMDVKAERFDEPLEARKHAHGADAKDTDLTVEDLKALVVDFKQVVREDTGREFPTDVYEQLDLAVKAVFASWFGKRANDYRNSQKIAHDLGTAVNVMTHGLRQHGRRLRHRRRVHAQHRSTAPRSCTASTSSTPRARTWSRASARPEPISQLKDEMPEALRGVPAHRRPARGPLPGRPGPRVHDRARQALHAADAHRQAHRRRGREDRRPDGERGRHQQAGGRRAHRAGPGRPAAPRPVRPQGAQGRRDRSRRASTPRRAPPSAEPSSTPTSRSSGSRRARRSSSCASRLSPDDFHGMAVAQGILTARGGATSHAAVVARQIGKPCVAGCAELVVDYDTKTRQVQR